MTRELQFSDSKRQQQYLAFRLMINDYKVSRGCVECGYNKHPAALDFNHKDPKQKVQRIAAMYSYSHEKVLAELEKCEILCANCHRIKTFEQGLTRGQIKGQRGLGAVIVEGDPIDFLIGNAASVWGNSAN